MSSSSLPIARRLFELAARGDIDGYLSLCDEEVVTRPLTGRQSTYCGHRGIRDFFARAKGPMIIENLELTDHGDWVVASGRLGVGATLGKPIDLPAAWALRFAEGRLVEGRSFHRRDEAVAAVGEAGSQ